MPDDLLHKLALSNKKNSGRASELGALFKSYSNEQSRLYERIWPHLTLISCWTDAQAGLPAEVLKQAFNHVEFQGKGLLATEGIISFPLLGQPGAALAVRSHFYEFIQCESEGEEIIPPKIRLAHELEKNKRYNVVLTTGGGLYRYKLGDSIEVVGFFRDCPIIVFTGRDKVSDLCGEKLHEAFVHDVLKRLFLKLDLKPEFAMHAPEKSDSGLFFYTLFLQPGGQCNHDTLLSRLGRELEENLLENFHYGYCRKIGQLAAAELFIINRDGYADFIKQCIFDGQKLGDIKPAALHRSFGWSAVFTGNYQKKL